MTITSDKYSVLNFNHMPSVNLLQLKDQKIFIGSMKVMSVRSLMKVLKAKAITRRLK